MTADEDGASIGVMECSGIRWRWWSHNLVNVQKTSEFYTLQWLIVCYVNFTLMKTRKVVPFPEGQIGILHGTQEARAEGQQGARGANRSCLSTISSGHRILVFSFGDPPPISAHILK